MFGMRHDRIFCLTVYVVWLCNKLSAYVYCQLVRLFIYRDFYLDKEMKHNHSKKGNMSHNVSSQT